MTDEKRRRKGIFQMLKTEYVAGDIVPASAIYECSTCESITAFKKGEKFLPCDDCEGVEDQSWYRTNEFVRFVSKNVNTEFERVETFSLRLAEFIATIAGNVWFVYAHVIWFGLWIFTNTGHSLFGISNFDPYPFGFLTLVVSLEAIFLSTFILIAQNLQSRKSELRSDLDYQTNLKIEKDVAEALSILNEIRENGVMLDKRASQLTQEMGIVLDRKSKRQKKPSARFFRDVGLDVAHPHRSSGKRRQKA